MAQTHMFDQQDVQRSNGDDKKSLKRKMARGEKAPKSSAGGGKAKAPPAGSMRASPGGGSRGGRPRRVEEFGGYEGEERSGGRDPVIDRRFFDGFIDDFDMSDLS